MSHSVRELKPPELLAHLLLGQPTNYSNASLGKQQN